MIWQSSFRTFYLLAMALALISCSAESSSVAIEKGPGPQIAARTPTLQDWQNAISELVVEESSEDKGDGVVEFLACFRVAGEKKCDTNSGRRDGFKNVRFFSTGLFASLGSAITAPYLKSYVSLPEGQMPVIMFSPVYTGDSWLFMNKVALMVDGKVIVEEEIQHSAVKRDTGVDYVDESYHFALDENEVAALRRIDNDSKLAIRISGEKGYVSVERDLIEIFQKDLIDLVAIHDLLANGLRNHIPPSVAAPKLD